MIVEIIGIRGSGKSTIHRLVKKELESRGLEIANCRTWDDEIRRAIRSRGYEVNLKNESGFQKNIYLSDWWSLFQRYHPITVQAYENVVNQVGNLKGEGPAKRMMTGRKYFVRWYRATKSNKLCLWDKGLLQVMSKLLLHEQQWKHFEWEKACAHVMPHWPLSDLYVDLVVSPQVAFERARARPGPQWNREDHEMADYVFAHLTSWLPSDKILKVDNDGSPEHAVERIVCALDSSNRS